MATRAQIAATLTRHATGGEWIEIFPAEWSVNYNTGDTPVPLLAEDSDGFWVLKVYRRFKDLGNDNSSNADSKSRPFIRFSIPCPNIVEAKADDIGNLAAAANEAFKLAKTLSKFLKENTKPR